MFGFRILYKLIAPIDHWSHLMSEVKSPSTEDEIDLRDLAIKVWRSRYVISASVVLSVTAAFIFTAIPSIIQPSNNRITSYIALTGITKGEYPNGAEFSPSDLLSQEVLDRASEIIGNDFDRKSAESISIVYGSPFAQNLQSELNLFMSANSNAKLDQLPEVIKERQDYEGQINALNQSSLKLSIDHTKLGISQATAEALSEAIPTAWQSIYTDKYRVNLSNAITDLVQVQLPSKLTSTVELIEADRFLEAARSSLSFLKNDARVSYLTSSSGQTATDLIYELNNFSSLYLDGLLAQSWSKDESLTIVYMRQLESQKDELVAQLNAAEQTVDDLLSMRNQNQRSSSTPLENTGNDNTQLTLGDGGLTALISLAQQSSMQDYMIKTFEERSDIKKKLAVIDTKIKKINGEPISGLNYLLPIAEEKLSQLDSQIRDLMTKSEATMRQRNREMYQFSSSPSLEITPITKPNMMAIALACILGAFLGLAIGIMRQSIGSRTNELDKVGLKI